MTFPRRAHLLPALALLTLVGLTAAAALAPGRASAQNAPSKQQSPNGKIVFQSTTGSDNYVNDIYVMDADGKHQTRLTDDAGDDVSAKWSPQGNRIAFLSDRRGGGSEIFLMNADGSDQCPLRDVAPVRPFTFEWSPDGTRLAYKDWNDGDVHVAEVTSCDAENKPDPVNVSLHKPGGTSDSEPSWSPDGSRLVVVNFAGCGGCTELHVFNAFDGSNRITLSTGPDFEANPSWSPDGSLIAYEGKRGERGIYVTPSNGVGPETNVSGAVGSFGGPVWSPMGSRVAFPSDARTVYAVNANGSGLKRLSDEPSMGDIFWSPDCTQVGFHNANTDGWVDIFVVNSDGSARHSANYTKTKRADEFSAGWQKLP
jgi:Tol biopolymer transport system component